MENTELIKRYATETGKSARDELYSGSIKLYIPTNDYIAWLESQVTESLEPQTIEKFQEIIRNQCDEISELKAQLRWRPTTEKPEKDGEYFVKFHYTDGEEGMDVCDFTNGEWYWDDIISWLPIPPVPEGE